LGAAARAGRRRGGDTRTTAGGSWRHGLSNGSGGRVGCGSVGRGGRRVGGRCAVSTSGLVGGSSRVGLLGGGGVVVVVTAARWTATKDVCAYPHNSAKEK
jgi:hypothetical protein